MAARNKAERFVELANKRVNKAIKCLRLVNNLSNRKNYQYSEDQAKKIVKALQKEIDSIRQGFQDSDSQQQYDFQL